MAGHKKGPSPIPSRLPDGITATLDEIRDQLRVVIATPVQTPADQRVSEETVRRIMTRLQAATLCAGAGILGRALAEIDSDEPRVISLGYGRMRGAIELVRLGGVQPTDATTTRAHGDTTGFRATVSQLANDARNALKSPSSPTSGGRLAADNSR